MRKPFKIAPLIALALTVVIVTSGASVADRANGLTLVSPSACPAGGCAAGQHLNYEVEFSITPDYTSGVNTQVCVYATSGWADFTNGWLSEEGLFSSQNYTLGQTDSVCTDNAGAYDWLEGAHAQFNANTSDRLAFALNITASASSSGDIVVKVFELNSGGTSWVESPQTYSDTITSVAALDDDVFVGDTAVECGGYSPCFINSSDDRADGVGTGLRDAVLAQNPGDDILILGDYPIKGQTVLIDKALTISGMNDGKITTISGAPCNNPMLRIETGATLQDLIISDEYCYTPSRTLIEVDSPDNVVIEHNTLTDGNYAIQIQDNAGDVRVAFNQITDNNYHAVYNSGTANEVSIYANNIIDNGSPYQVDCNNNGTADHNYWGESELASGNSRDCGVDDGKRLGTAIDVSDGGAGVEALRTTVTSTKTYAFDNQIAYSTSVSSDYDIVIVNHGHGSSSNVPFYDVVGDSISPCSDFYDIFVLEGETPTNLTLDFKYNLNSNCTSLIESSDYCGSGDSSKYPLWWYDPATSSTDKWDPTGPGQLTTCTTAQDEIRVVIDATGRPNINTDLGFTPFIVGVENPDGIKLSQFSVTFDGTENDVRWTTTEERNIKGFHVLRSDTENGTYARVSPFIDANGDAYVGGIYRYDDDTISFRQTYYYKLEVVNNDDETVGTHGPVSVLTSTATPTVTLTRTPTITRTPYPTRTSTPYYYRSPTSYYRPATSTPRSGPTQVRTYGPTPTPSRTSQTKPTYNPTTGEGGYPSGYPLGTVIAQSTQGYPVPGDAGSGDRTTTPGPGSEGQSGNNSGPDGSGSGDLTGSPRIQWIYLIAGAASGLALLGLTSLILSKTRIA
ncbi:right-handed parallel beta-helix repeat-containing protein [bacterium]|nr:right-handed parallel beta-helix repeat-containing protein [bacterium]